ncbi:MAG: hypothetical protein J3K34DRAFT_525958 [Monoraphidium minutum]|nr:MAG: hypothetical protein J3K34DRAFT_525958 [Monoraphidium minutum]
MPRRRLPPLLLLLALAARAAAPAAAQGGAPTYAVDWAAVPDAPAAAKDLQSDCICAVLGAACTPNCCCDARCPKAAVAAFKAEGSCLPEGVPPQQLDYCSPADAFARVNLPSGDFYRLQKRAADEDFLTQLLCVSGDNNPGLGDAYPDPATGPTTDNAKAAQCGAAARAPAAPKGAYVYGDAVISAAPLADGSVARGRFTVAAGGASAECGDWQQVGFLRRVPASLKESAATCWRTLPSDPAAFAALCRDAASPLSPLAIAHTQFPANPAAALAFNATLASVARLDPTTGALTEGVAAAAPAFAPATAAGPAVCRGVVARADYVLSYSLDAALGAAQLAAVAVEVTVTDVALPAAAAAGAAPPPALAQAASVAWADAAAPAAALPPLSGAPGYLEGFPLLAGLRQASGAKAAVARLKGGLQLPAPAPGGGCGGAGRGGRVAFGYNATASCAHAATRAELRVLCAAAAADPAAAAGPARAAAGGLLLDAALDGSLMLGVWGSSNAANVNEWVPVAVASWPPAAPTWSEEESRCDGVITGFELKVVTGAAFSAGNPQRKVLHAQLCLTAGSWAFDARRGAPAAPQALPLAFSARFAPLDQGRPVAALRPAPPLVVPLPPGLFYPFLQSDE